MSRHDTIPEVTLDLAFVRSCFPALDTAWALMDNAGGSVTARPVIERVTEYMSRYQMQIGASYALSQEAEALVRAGEAAAAELIGASVEETIVGPSTTANLQTLARALAPTMQAGDELVVTDLDHESNIGCWLRLAERGIVIKTWHVRPETARLELEDLDRLLGPRTKLVTFTHCANVVGEIMDVGAVAAYVREHSDALTCADGVAFAPHRLVDVASLGVDFYALSLYKVYGPHLGVLWGKREHLVAAKGQNHEFIAETQLPYKFQPGNVTHELAAGLPGIVEYFEGLAKHHGIEGATVRERLAGVFEHIAAHEAQLAERLLAFLREHPRVRIIGPEHADPGRRVPTIAFVVDGIASDAVVPRLDEARVAVRHGHFYAKRAIEALELPHGVVRVSMVHYNTLEEVDRLIEALESRLR